MKEHRERSPKRGLGLVLLALLLFFGAPVFSVGDISFPGSIPSVSQDAVDDGAGGADGSDGSGDQGDSVWSDDGGSDASQGASTVSAVDPERRDLDDHVFYVRSQLSREDREAYDLMYQALAQRDEVALDLGSPDELARLRDCVLADHPEIFYTKGISYRGNAGSYLVSGSYTHSEESARDAMDMIEMVADECLRGLPPGADDYETAKYIYEYIIDNTTYGDELSDGQTIENVLIDKQAVCAGYAATFQYLMQSLGFPCVYVTGDASEAHAWCAVELDGDWYLVDPTWGDPSYTSSDGPKDRLSYKYLCITDADISATHTDLSPYDVPQCVATKNNYYVREGLYFETADVARAGNLIGEALDGGEERIEIRCASRDVYDELKRQFVDEGKLYDYISSGSYSYTTEDHMLVLGFLRGDS